MARIRLTLLSFTATAAFATSTVAAEVVSQTQPPHAPNAFWTGVVTLAGISVIRGLRRAATYR